MPASRSALARTLSDAFDFATNHAKAMGALGGYTDQWLGNELAGSEAGRKISLANSNAEQIKSLLAAERQDAEIKATHRTSPWGTALTVAGNIMGAAGGVPGLRAIYVLDRLYGLHHISVEGETLRLHAPDD
jgi:hypothetical protein